MHVSLSVGAVPESEAFSGRDIVSGNVPDGVYREVPAANPWYIVVANKKAVLLVARTSNQIYDPTTHPGVRTLRFQKINQPLHLAIHPGD